MEVTEGKGCPVVYESIGRDTFTRSLDCLRPLGVMASYGHASGAPDPVDVVELGARGSLFVTRPAIMHYMEERKDLVASAKELFEVMSSGAVTVDRPPPLSAARGRPQVHRAHGSSAHHGLDGAPAVRVTHFLSRRAARCRTPRLALPDRHRWRAMAICELSELKGRLAADARLLGLDLGAKTIGVAVSDVSRTIATARTTLRRTKLSRDIETLRALIEGDGIGGIVVGLPVNMDGSEGPRAQSARDTAARLAEALALPVAFWDERWSTVAAERAMLDADLSRRKRARKVDQVAAAYILQGALDRLHQS